jgi:hypothetical protein
MYAAVVTVSLAPSGVEVLSREMRSECPALIFFFFQKLGVWEMNYKSLYCFRISPDSGVPVSGRSLSLLEL